MTVLPGQWAAQQLAEFLAIVSRATGETEAARLGVEHAAEAVEADVAALVRAGAVLASVGWPRFEVPDRDLAAAAAGGGGVVPVPGAGGRPVTVVDLEDDETRLVVARADGHPFADDERAVLRGAAGALGLTMRLLRTIAAERTLRARSDLQARENARLLETLRKRQRLLDATSGIQRAISQRRPLDEVLQAIVAAAAGLLGEAAPTVLLLEDAGAGALRVAAVEGSDAHGVTPAHRIGEGAGGRAVAEDRLVVVDDYQLWPGAMPERAAAGLRAAMAAPVHEDGRAVGSLVVSSFVPGRPFSQADQELLRSFAEHASLALTDARRADTLLHQALHDGLTGLPNRVLFTDRLQHALNQGLRRGTSCGVLVLDVDRFKTVNESLGHEAGDELLVAVAARIDAALRSTDTAARLGGDEFAALLEDLADADEAEQVAARLTAALREPVVISGREVYVSASVGIAIGTAGATDLLRQADVAVARAKREGKGRVRVFDSAMDSAPGRLLELEADLQRALERDELVAFYQPIIALDGATLAGFEALVRWHHPERGLVPPGDFIPLAEETGLIVALGRHVLRAACRQAVAWQRSLPAATPPLMSVNLSGRQLEDPGLVADVAEALADSGLAPSSLVLEITETVLMQDIETTIERLQELRALGVRLAVDDFGTGYSSLTYLRGFPVDVLKVAKPFVDGIGIDEEGTALARAIVDMAASLGLRCVAEGIEHAAQAQALRAMGCGLGQGFHFARPMPADELTALIAQPPSARAFAIGQ